VQTNQGKAEYQRALQQAAQIKALAQAEAEKVARVGIAQALATEEQVRAYGGPQFQVTQTVMNRFAEAIQQAGVDVVPRVVVNGGSQDGSTTNGSIMEGLLTMLLSEKAGVNINSPAGASRSPEVETLREQIRQSLQNTPQSDQPATTGETPPPMP
jgi:hypothetical protein